MSFGDVILARLGSYSFETEAKNPFGTRLGWKKAILILSGEGQCLSVEDLMTCGDGSKSYTTRLGAILSSSYTSYDLGYKMNPQRGS